MEDFSQLFNNESQSKLYNSRPEYSPDIAKEIIDYWRLFNKDRKIENHLTIIDVGCGTGQLTKELVPYARKLIGIDSSESQIKEAIGASIGPLNTQFMVCSCYNLPADDGTVDLITAAQCVHWFDIDRFYADVDRSLKKGGVLVISAYGKGYFVIDGVEDPKSSLNKFVAYDLWFGENYFGCTVNDNLKWAATRLTGLQFLYPNTGIRREDLSIQMVLTLTRYGDYIRSTSVYQTWKRNHPEKRDIVDIVLERILCFLGNPETKLETELLIKFPLCLIMCAKD